MNLLRELSPHTDPERIVARYGTQPKPKQADRIRQLFTRLAERPDTSKTEMVRLLFGQSRTASHPPFQRLIETLNVVTLQEYLTPSGRYTASSSRHEMVQRCERTYALLFMTSDKSNEAKIKYWHQLVRSARQCHHVPLELECQQVLQAIYGYRAYDEDLLSATEAAIRECLAQNEAIAQSKIAVMDQRMARLEGHYEENIPLDEIERYVVKYPLYDVQYAGGELLVQEAIDRGHWPAALIGSQRALVFFRKHFPRERQPLIHFLYNQVLVYVALRDLKNGLACWNELYRICQKKNNRERSRKIIELGIILTLRCGAAGECCRLLKAIEEIGGASAIPAPERGRWITFYHCLALLNDKDPQLLELLSAEIRKLKRGNENIKFYPEDLLNLRIMECLELLRQQSFRRAAGIVAGLRQELPKRISADNPNYRLHLFLKLLVESTKANFHRAATLRNTEKSWQRLLASSSGISDQDLEMELVPFEKLWEILLATLTEKAPRRPYLAA